jgi:hypothetical protein
MRSSFRSADRRRFNARYKGVDHAKFWKDISLLRGNTDTHIYQFGNLEGRGTWFL